MNQTIIISRLLDKYENSKHLTESGTPNRRVMLRIGPGKKDFPEYCYEDATIRDNYNDAAQTLERAGLVFCEWVKGRPVLSAVILNLENVMDAYCLIGREHPKVLAEKVAALLDTRLASVSTNWISSWKNATCLEAKQEFRIPSFCKKDLSTLDDLLTALCEYDTLCGESITMRAFSSRCYHDTKYFERNVRDCFLGIARKYDLELCQICEQESLGIKDELAYLGIYARPEHYELAGNIVIQTKYGAIDLCAVGPYGLAFPSTVVDQITSIDLGKIHKVTFIENKTNYDEYILSELQPDELAVYHGGFLSPQKRKLFAILNSAIHQDCEVFFWADIDLGGFRMHDHLKEIVPCVKPMRMSEQDVAMYYHQGFVRSTEYLHHLQDSHFNQEGSPFKRCIQKILEYGVTIEQEAFLSTPSRYGV